MRSQSGSTVDKEKGLELFMQKVNLAAKHKSRHTFENCDKCSKFSILCFITNKQQFSIYIHMFIYPHRNSQSSVAANRFSRKMFFTHERNFIYDMQKMRDNEIVSGNIFSLHKFHFNSNFLFHREDEFVTQVTASLVPEPFPFAQPATFPSHNNDRVGEALSFHSSRQIHPQLFP
jgi:DNA primase large subunit